jgi:fumarate reductase subunit D
MDLMDEMGLLKLWNQKRTQIIQAQIAPALVLIAVMVLSALGIFDKANDSAKYLALGVAAVTGILAMITQYATIREAEALIADLKRIKNSSELAKKIADSRALVSLTAIAIVGMGIAVFSLVTWAVLGQ